MGQICSKNLEDTKVNYNCPVCMSSNKLPNLNGRFFIVNETHCRCNGCNTLFEKKQFYKSLKNGN